MLQSIRDQSKGWIAYVVVGLISIPFVFFGIQSYLGAGGDTVVAEVNGTEINTQQFDQSLRLQQQRLREMFGNNIPDGLLDQGMISQSVISSLVRNELLRQYAEESGLAVSDAEVISQIHAIPAFQDNGQFSAEKFDQLLSAQRRDKTGFVEEMRQSLKYSQLQDIVATSAFLTEREMTDFLTLRNETRDVSYVIIPRKNFLDQVVPTDEEIQAHYDANSASFQSEEKVKIEYLVLDLKSVEAGIVVPEDEIRAVYDDESDRFMTAASRKAAQILLTGETADATAAEVAEKLMTGGDFAALAAEFSTDKLTKDKGGDMGWIYPGDLDSAVSDALFALNAGEVSAPVKSDRGVHIITFTEEKAGEQQSFDAVKSRLEREYRQREAERVLVDQSEQLLTLTYENQDSLVPAADALGVKVQTSDWLTRAAKSDGVLADPKVLQAAFTDAVRLERKNSDVIETADGKQVVLRVSAHEPAATLTLENVRDQVVNAIKQDKAAELAKQAGIQMLAKVQAGAVLADVAAEQSFDVINESALGRQSGKVSPEVVTQLFKVSRPADGAVTSTGFDLMSGDFLVATVNAVNAPEVAGNAIESAETQRLTGTLGNSEFEALYRALESRAEITINQQALVQ